MQYNFKIKSNLNKKLTRKHKWYWAFVILCQLLSTHIKKKKEDHYISSSPKKGHCTLAPKQGSTSPGKAKSNICFL
jgi:hypothetical protein